MFTVHILAVIFSFAVIVYADHHAFAWFRGKTPVIPARTLRRIHALTWTGLATLMASGAYMAYPLREYLFTHPPFIGKMLFVGILLVNGVLIGRLLHVASEKPFAALTTDEKLPLFMSGAISGFSWLGALTLAFFLF